MASVLRERSGNNADKVKVPHRAEVREFTVAAATPLGKFLCVDEREMILLDRRGRVVEEMAWAQVQSVSIERYGSGWWHRPWLIIRGRDTVWRLRPRKFGKPGCLDAVAEEIADVVLDRAHQLPSSF